MWEDDSRPAFGDDGQEVINRQLLLQEYVIFIGIMWARFGSPTKRAESGTYEEFEDAYKKNKENKELEICMYFNKKDIPQKGMDPEQIIKVFEFKKKVSELGGLYYEYLGAEQFKEKLYTHLTKYFLEKHDVTNEHKDQLTQNSKASDLITPTLKGNLVKSLSMFKGQNPCWIDPVLSKTNLISSNYVENYEARIKLDDIIENPTSIIIKSPPQFGLTTLANYFILEAWNENNIWIYLDASKTNRNAIEKAVLYELKNTYYTEDPSCIKCIILDSWKNSMHGGMKMLKSLSDNFKEVPIIVMQTIDASNFLQEPSSENIDREFQVLHLLALPKSEIRKMVSSYNEVTFIDEEDKVLNKIVKDLDTLNIHRTPMWKIRTY
jgi:hypothetical protein